MANHFMSAINTLKAVEAAARMFKLGQEVIEERLLDLAIMAAKDKAHNWELEDETFPVETFRPSGPSVLLKAWAWYIPRNRPKYQTPVKYVEHSLGGEPDAYRVYRSGKKLVCPEK